LLWKVTVGLVSHWPCVGGTENARLENAAPKLQDWKEAVVYPTTGSIAQGRETSTQPTAREHEMCVLVLRLMTYFALYKCALYYMAAQLWNRADHYIFALWFLLSIYLSSSFFFSSPNLSHRRLDVYHASTHGVALYSANLGCRSETCFMRLAHNPGRKKSSKIRHLRTIAQVCRAISSQLRTSTIGKYK